MRLRDLQPSPPLVFTMIADVVAHHALTIVSVVAGVVSIGCSLAQTWFKYRASESFLARYRARCFRQWDQARDNPL